MPATSLWLVVGSRLFAVNKTNGVLTATIPLPAPVSAIAINSTGALYTLTSGTLATNINTTVLTLPNASSLIAPSNCMTFMSRLVARDFAPCVSIDVPKVHFLAATSAGDGCFDVD